MERVKETLFVTPEAEGWLLHSASGIARRLASLDEVAPAMHAGMTLHLALPCSALLIERMTLPATEPAELRNMVQLQLEKTLPFSMEDVASDFAVIAANEQESSVFSVAAPRGFLDELCQPLREKSRLPQTLTPYVCHVASACPADETVLTLHVEQTYLVLAIHEKGRLSWAHALPGLDPASFFVELPQILLTATVEGAEVTFARVLIAPEVESLEAGLQDYFGGSVEALPAIHRARDLAMNLVPASWQDLERSQERVARIRKGLLCGAAVVLALMAGALVYLTVLSRQARTLATQLAALQPALQRVQALQARSTALAPAIDRRSYAVEVLFLLQRNLPAPVVRLTEFDLRQGQWRAVGEAPSAQLAIDYLRRLKADPDLGGYQITATPPQIGVNEKAQFDITGKP